MNVYDAWVIHFADDNFAASPSRVRRICEELQKGVLPAFFIASARADDLVAEQDLLRAMADARILRLTVGVETLDSSIASVIGKPIPKEVYREAFARMRNLGIFSVASFIVGLPGDAPTAVEQAVKLAVDVGPDSAHFLPFVPMPGIPLASGRSNWNPDPTDIETANKCNEAFSRHKVVQHRLEAAASSQNIRGLLARATLDNRSEIYGPNSLHNR